MAGQVFLQILNGFVWGWILALISLGLSSAETRKLIPLIGELGESFTIVIIEHDIKFLMEVAQTLSVFHQGRKIAEGDPDSIRANEEVQEVYLRGTV